MLAVYKIKWKLDCDFVACNNLFLDKHRNCLCSHVWLCVTCDLHIWMLFAEVMFAPLSWVCDIHGGRMVNVDDEESVDWRLDQSCSRYAWFAWPRRLMGLVLIGDSHAPCYVPQHHRDEHRPARDVHVALWHQPSRVCHREAESSSLALTLVMSLKKRKTSLCRHLSRLLGPANGVRLLFHHLLTCQVAL